MSLIAGIDFSSHAIDVVLVDEDTGAPSWRRWQLRGDDAFERARYVRRLELGDTFDNVLAAGIEQPFGGHNAGDLFRVQGALLARLPLGLLVHPIPPARWRKLVGLSGRATKLEVARYAQTCLTLLTPRGARFPIGSDWAQDAKDAYCIALATGALIVKGTAA